MLFENITTWRDLLNALQQCPDSVLDQPAQIMEGTGDGDSIVPLVPVVCLGTVEALEVNRVRSSHDNKHHPEELVLMTDANPFALDGAIAYEMAFEAGNDGIVPIYPGEPT